MSQISPPIRILLVLAVALLAGWMLFLRPKTDEVVPEPAAPNVQTAEPAVSQPGKVAEAAQGAVEATNGHLAGQEAVDGVDAGEAAGAETGTTIAGKQAQGATARTAPADLKGVPKPVAKAIRKQQVLVILFWNGKSADDRAVRSALRDVDRWDGRVFVHAAPIKSISKYGRIARGVDVEQSPTIVVADPELRADTLVGYTDTHTIDQLVVDAMRNSTGIFTDAYLREVNDICRKATSRIWAQPRPDSLAGASTLVSKGRNLWRKYAGQFKAVAAPKKHRAFKRGTMRDNAAALAVYTQWAAYLGSKPTASRLVASIDRFGRRLTAIDKRYTRRMDDAHVLGCGSQY